SSAGVSPNRMLVPNVTPTEMISPKICSGSPPPVRLTRVCVKAARCTPSRAPCRMSAVTDMLQSRVRRLHSQTTPGLPQSHISHGEARQVYSQGNIRMTAHVKARIAHIGARFATRALPVALASLAFASFGAARTAMRAVAQTDSNTVVDPKAYQDLRWRSIGPHRGGRSTAVAGVRTQPAVFYMGASGGGVWKTENSGITWTPMADGQISTGSIGAIDVSDSNPNIVYVGTGSEAIRSNVILGRGAYKSTDAG